MTDKLWGLGLPNNTAPDSACYGWRKLTLPLPIFVLVHVSACCGWRKLTIHARCASWLLTLDDCMLHIHIYSSVSGLHLASAMEVADCDMLLSSANALLERAEASGAVDRAMLSDIKVQLDAVARELAQRDDDDDDGIQSGQGVKIEPHDIQSGHVAAKTDPYFDIRSGQVAAKTEPHDMQSGQVAPKTEPHDTTKTGEPRDADDGTHAERLWYAQAEHAKDVEHAKDEHTKDGHTKDEHADDATEESQSPLSEQEEEVPLQAGSAGWVAMTSGRSSGSASTFPTAPWRRAAPPAPPAPQPPPPPPASSASRRRARRSASGRVDWKERKTARRAINRIAMRSLSVILARLESLMHDP